MNHRLFIQNVPVVISACFASFSIASAQVPDLPSQVTDRDTLHRWLLQLKSRDAQVVDDAIRFFPRINPDAEDAETIVLLTLGLKDRNAYAKKYSAGCLIKLGPAGAAAIPELEAMLTDAELQGGVREWASRALVGMWPRSEEAMVALSRAMIMKSAGPSANISTGHRNPIRSRPTRWPRPSP